MSTAALDRTAESRTLPLPNVAPRATATHWESTTHCTNVAAPAGRSRGSKARSVGRAPGRPASPHCAALWAAGLGQQTGQHTRHTACGARAARFAALDALALMRAKRRPWAADRAHSVRRLFGFPPGEKALPLPRRTPCAHRIQGRPVPGRTALTELRSQAQGDLPAADGRDVGGEVRRRVAHCHKRHCEARSPRHGRAVDLRCAALLSLPPAAASIPLAAPAHASRCRDAHTQVHSQGVQAVPCHDRADASHRRALRAGPTPHSRSRRALRAGPHASRATTIPAAHRRRRAGACA